MKINEYSEGKLYATFEVCNVPGDFAEVISDYLLFGFHPGSFFSYVFENDFERAILSSHPANSIQALKNMVQWMIHHMPPESYGTREAFEQWMQLNDMERRTILEHHDLIYTKKMEVVLTLKNDSVDS